MSVTFDGPNKLVICAPGTTSLDASQLYEDWKNWVLLGNAGYLPALRTVGGDPTVGANRVAAYFFLLNGWRVRPQEAHHTLTVTGSLVVDGGGNCFVPTVGNYQVQVVQSVPVLAEAVSTSGGGGTAPSAEQVADAVWSKTLAVAAGNSAAALLRLVGDVTRNRVVTDPVAGTITVYDLDDVTVLYTAPLYADAAGTQPYTGEGADRRDRLA